MKGYGFENVSGDTFLSSTQNVEAGPSFQGAGEQLYGVTFLLKKTGSPTGSITARIYIATTTWTSGVAAPAGGALVSSNPIDVASLPTNYTEVAFTFPTPFTATNGMSYFVILDYYGGNSVNNVGIGADLTSPTYPGVTSRLIGGSWSQLASDICFSLHLAPSTPLYDVELPGVYLDNLIEDPVPGVVGLRPILMNENPGPGETGVPKNTPIAFELATLGAAGSVDLAATQVFVNGALVFSASAPVLPWTGSTSLPQADVRRFTLVPPADFASEQVVTVRVVSKAVGDPGVLDTSYSFTIADTSAPQVTAARALNLNTIRVTFSENVLQTGAADPGSALNPANWKLLRLGDYLVPLVSAWVVAATMVTTNSIDLVTNIPLTPGGNYRLVATALEDVNGNPVSAPNNTRDFQGWVPPAPENRDFDLYKRLPNVNRREDDTKDLFRFIGCFQEVLTLLLYDVDRFTDILDPDLAPEDFVDAMLLDLGNPFDFDLELEDKRRLVQVLVDMYRLKGTKPGIENVVRFFLGLEVSVDAYNSSLSTWLLGDSELGVTTILGTQAANLLYSFEIVVGVALTDTQREQLREIAEYMKPAHTHLVRIVEPQIPVVLDHWELGLSELGESTILH